MYPRKLLAARAARRCYTGDNKVTLPSRIPLKAASRIPLKAASRIPLKAASHIPHHNDEWVTYETSSFYASINELYKTLIVPVYAAM